VLVCTSGNYELVVATINGYARRLRKTGTVDDIVEHFAVEWEDADLDSIASNELLMSELQAALDALYSTFESTGEVALIELTELEWKWLDALGLVQQREGDWYFDASAARTTKAQQKLKIDEALALYGNDIEGARRQQEEACELLASERIEADKQAWYELKERMQWLKRRR